ncbi:MAG: hypothetical protein PVH61_13960 [Candidatus Aminicenantes bacterium]|jgi:hypothetical protein
MIIFVNEGLVGSRFDCVIETVAQRAVRENATHWEDIENFLADYREHVPYSTHAMAAIFAKIDELEN